MLPVRFYPRSLSRNVETISWMACDGGNADGGPDVRAKICSGDQRPNRTVVVDAKTLINDISLTCHCMTAINSDGEEDCQSTACTDQRCQGGGPTRSFPWLQPWKYYHGAKIGKCDRMGIYVCDAENFRQGREGPPETAVQRIDEARRMTNQNFTAPFLFVGLDEISVAAANLEEYFWDPVHGELKTGRVQPAEFHLADILVWIQYNLINIIRKYTRGSRRLWREGRDNDLIREKLSAGEIKYSLVLNVCTPMGDAIITNYHYWNLGPLHSAGDSFRNGLPVERRAPKTIGQKMYNLWKKLGGSGGLAGLDNTSRGGHRRTNRLRRVRRRRKKTKRRRKRRRRRRRRRRQKTRRRR